MNKVFQQECSFLCPGKRFDIFPRKKRFFHGKVEERFHFQSVCQTAFFEFSTFKKKFPKCLWLMSKKIS